MDTVFWVILIVVAVGIVWWLLNRNSSAKSEPGDSAAGSQRADGALSSGGAAASAEAAGTAGIATAAGFGQPAEPAGPTTAEEPAETSASGAPASGRGESGSTAVPGAATPSPAAQASGTPAVSHHDDSQDNDDSQDSRGTARDELRRQDQAEWETQWSEASGSVPARATAATVPAAEPVPHPAPNPAPNAAAAAPATAPVHHPEYTEPHAPTLPGAETAAVEETDDDGVGRLNTAAPATAQVTGTAHQGIGGTEADGGPAGARAASSFGVPPEAAAAETQDRAQSSAVVEAGADHSTPAGQPDAEAGTRASGLESTGHLAADEPYGAGSAAAGADGSGPADYGVKGDAGAMVYYEEGHPDFDQTRADVWFESAAHAEAAGFRAPRRRRL